MGLVANRRMFEGELGFWANQYKGLAVQTFRDYVWEVFKRILRETPQYTGKAVANWNLSIGSPNFDFDDNLGDKPEYMSSSAFFPSAVHEKGDERWMRIARNRARPIKDQIRSGDKVFICNGTSGDDDLGVGEPGGGPDGFNYMAAFQNAGYWSQHLREVNKPYETVQESMIIVATQFSRRGFQLPRVGTSWD